MALEQHSGYEIKDANKNVRFIVDDDGNMTFKDANGVVTGSFDSTTGNFIIKGRYLNRWS